MGGQFPVDLLWRFRGALGMSQREFAKILNEGRHWLYTQEQISSKERGLAGYTSLRELATAYFRAAGYDADGSGSINWLRPEKK